MKNCFTLCLGAWLAVMSGPGVARATLANGSFESWNLLGWTLHSDVGNLAAAPFQRPSGLARTMSTWGEALVSNPATTPQTGSRFLGINTRANANFLGNDTYNTFVSQTISLNEGEIVSGWSLFYNGDAEPLDSAWVRILDQSGGLIGAPWMETSGTTVSQLAIVAPSDWALWQWAAPTTGSYTIQLGVTTSGADNNASYGFFDGISVQAVPVPEPTAMALAVLGGLALLTVRNRIR